MQVPRILIAGVRGGSGKTLISLGLLAAWRKLGCQVSSFKKGPDYIDAAWLSEAAGLPCRNLDLFLMSSQAVLGSFASWASGSEVAVIEGNRGLYDGVDSQGSYSTAELAKLLQTPVILSVDCTKATRTVAAVVLGCQRLDPQVDLRGVILNQTAGPRHESVLREAVEGTCGLPVLGLIPRIREQVFPERHLGLVPPQEHGRLASAIERAAGVAEEYLDLEAIRNLAQQAPALEPPPQGATSRPAPQPEAARIGVFRDAAFQFYYPENLEALERRGARLIEVSPILDPTLPEVDALYIGGGFPETLAPALADNRPFLDSLRRTIEQGLPVYAECGGTVYLGETLLFEDKEYPMVGALPVAFGFAAKPQGHGYTVLEAVEPNPFYNVGEQLRGHEFHYTYMRSSPEGLKFAFRVNRGHGFDGQRDGLCHRQVLACYTHVHALGAESWAPSLLRTATRYRARGARND
jgi:cobyrinic acid a,c-diamide synthase